MKRITKGLKALESKVQKQLPKVTQTSTTQLIESKKEDPFKNRRSRGPQLVITRILMQRGILTSKQIWRSYVRMIKQSRTLPETGQNIDYFPSLTKLKLTLKFMRKNQKIRSNGYNHKERKFTGWKLNEDRALKYIHPKLVQMIRESIKRKDQL